MTAGWLSCRVLGMTCILSPSSAVVHSLEVMAAASGLRLHAPSLNATNSTAFQQELVSQSGVAPTLPGAASTPVPHAQKGSESTLARSERGKDVQTTI